MAINFKSKHFPKSLVLTCMCLCLSYKLSLRDLEEIDLRNVCDRGQYRVILDRQNPEALSRFSD